MNIHPTRDAFASLAAQGNVIPVYTDLMADFETPVSAYAKLKEAGPSYLLESVEGGENLSRYSFIGCRPRKIFVCGPEMTEVRIPGQPSETIPTPRDPLTLIAVAGILGGLGLAASYVPARRARRLDPIAALRRE